MLADVTTNGAWFTVPLLICLAGMTVGIWWEARR